MKALYLPPATALLAQMIRAAVGREPARPGAVGAV